MSLQGIFDPVVRAYFKNESGGGSGGGEADHSMEDALIMGNCEHYVNDRVTQFYAAEYNYKSALSGVALNLKSVSMAKLESVSDGAFSDFYTALTSVDFPSLKSVPESMFFCCGELTNVNLPAATTIGNFAFGGCASITNLSLPSAETIGDGVFAFENYDSPVVIDLPKASSIGYSPFPMYTNAHILLRNASVVTANGNLDEEEMFEGYIYVPLALVDSYKTAQYWSSLANRIRALEDYTVDGTITGELDKNKI